MGKSCILRLVYRRANCDATADQELPLQEYRLDYARIQALSSALVQQTENRDVPFSLEYYLPQKGSFEVLGQDFVIFKDEIKAHFKGELNVIVTSYPAPDGNEALIRALQLDVSQLKEQVQRLDEEVRALRRGQPEEKEQPPDLTFRHRKTSLSKKLLDVAILFSDPLVFYNAKHEPVAEVEPVSYRTEIHSLQKLFRMTPLVIRCHVATSENLASSI
jgi:hypothetical protein